jgi:hypothetical protein
VAIRLATVLEVRFLATSRHLGPLKNSTQASW